MFNWIKKYFVHKPIKANFDWNNWSYYEKRIYPEKEFKKLIVKLSNGDVKTIPVLVKWIERNYPNDPRPPYIKNKMWWHNIRYEKHDALSVLHLFGIHPCGLCSGCDWPNLKPKPECKECSGTGWYRLVKLPPGHGFTLGNRPGLFPVQQNNETWEKCIDRISKEVRVDADKTFKEIYQG